MQLHALAADYPHLLPPRLDLIKINVAHGAEVVQAIVMLARKRRTPDQGPI